MESARPQVLIADDHVVFAEALRLPLETSYSVIGIAADGRALVREAAGSSRTSLLWTSACHS